MFEAQLQTPLQMHAEMSVDSSGDCELSGHGLHALASIWSVRLLYVFATHATVFAAERRGSSPSLLAAPPWSS
mgnify:CR=1 FL=1